MIIDARQIGDISLLETDVAIIGGGPAGLSIAQTFLGGNVQVCVLESGDHDYDDDTQLLYEGESVGIDYPVDTSRLRQLGGSSNHWGGYCRPLDPIDFEKRAWVPNSGWPISRAELGPYYERALPILDLKTFEFDDPSYWLSQQGETNLAFPAGRLYARTFQFSPPTRFGEKYRADLKKSENVATYLFANVTSINAEENGRTIRDVSVRSLVGNAFTVKAKLYVLAAGGLENPRILLYSNNVMKSGLGNDNDVVGRYFMEHPHLSDFCDLVVRDAAQVPSLFQRRQTVDDTRVKMTFVPNESFVRDHQLLNASFTIGLAGEYGNEEPDGFSDYDRERRKMLRAAKSLLRGEGGQENAEDGYWFGVGCACEQVPNPDSRVMLSDDLDVLGLPKLKLDWRLTEQDRYSVVAHTKSLGYEFGAMGKGRVRLAIPDDTEWPDEVYGGNHHMGTTRMSDDPKTGVVDASCKVHGIDNLYVAGSSVFPTCGSANPTLSLVSLALRLADHLAERLEV